MLFAEGTCFIFISSGHGSIYLVTSLAALPICKLVVDFPIGLMGMMWTVAIITLDPWLLINFLHVICCLVSNGFKGNQGRRFYNPVGVLFP